MITHEIKVKNVDEARDVLVVLSNIGYDTSLLRRTNFPRTEFYLHIWDSNNDSDDRKNKITYSKNQWTNNWTDNEVKQINYKLITSPLYKVLQGA